MSIEIRFLNNGKKEIIRVRNAGVTPVQVNFYEKREEVPYSIRHYCPEKSKFVEPDAAYMLGCGEQLYPDFQKCIMEEHRGERCTAESCIYWEKASGKCVVTARGVD